MLAVLGDAASIGITFAGLGVSVTALVISTFMNVRSQSHTRKIDRERALEDELDDLKEEMKACKAEIASCKAAREQLAEENILLMRKIVRLENGGRH